MPSPNLAVAHVAASQNQKEVTINDAVDALDLAMNASLDIDCGAGGTIAVTAAHLRRNLSLVLTGAPASGFTLQLPAVRKLLYVQNTTARPATVIGPSGGAGVTVAAGQRSLVYGTGSLALPIETALGVTGVTPGSYGDGGNVPRITVDAQGRITAISTLPASGEGGGGAPAWFGGATGSPGAASTTAYATKGIVFVPDRPLLVSHAGAYMGAAAAGQEHYAQIAEVTGATGSDTVTTVLATSSTLLSTATDLRCYRFAFADILLDVGKSYLLATVNASGTDTTANRTATIASGLNTAWDLDAPGQTAWGTLQFASLGLTASQAPSGVGTGKYTITLEGLMI